jgi:hypothetical protein
MAKPMLAKKTLNLILAKHGHLSMTRPMRLAQDAPLAVLPCPVAFRPLADSRTAVNSMG